MLIAEDLLLLVLDDEKGTLSSSWVQQALGGAILTELVMAGSAQVVPKSGLTAAKAAAVPGRRPDEPILAAAYDSLAAKPLTAKNAVNNLGKGLHESLAARLCDRNILRRRDDRILGIFPRTTWPAADSTHENGVRAQLVSVLIHGATPDARTGPLVALLSSINFAHKVVDTRPVGAGAVKARAKEIAKGDWAAKGVKDAMDEVTAVMTAVMVSTTAATSVATT
ncbi:Golgi phosphoprotein 3 GPP34 [Nocardioides albertanoniae]|uniref:Golgi phosphoprotein 3 GPP34 n=1 Tax=Nocardioides albertanoniae TaxID=1175486 RepID=A0A543ABP5_9ACTN|nr:GPP34 family phosphoprotein [Nocardioides albertanoniae]TQL70022.1 Golgi phosphoprotein 3 GPP34 [Nocardioides albertanoniae]